jgi:hypothetical protein
MPEKAKPVARRGRKATGLRDLEIAGLHGRRQFGFFYGAAGPDNIATFKKPTLGEPAGSLKEILTSL